MSADAKPGHDQSPPPSVPIGDVTLPWIAADANAWGVRLLDVRPITHTVRAFSQNPACAENLFRVANSDGREFSNRQPRMLRRVEFRLDYRVDEGGLAEGVLFRPTGMEDKWGLFVCGHTIVCVRSWMATVEAIIEFRPSADGRMVTLTSVTGPLPYMYDEQAPEQTAQVVDYVLRAHSLNLNWPLPDSVLREGTPEANSRAALVAFTAFGAAPRI